MTPSFKVRQAIAILRNISDDHAESILERLPSRDLRCLIRAMRELDAASEGQLVEALELFARDLQSQQPVERPAAPKQAVGDLLAFDPLTHVSQYSHFGFLVDYSPQQIGRMLSDEHPRTIAIVLGLLPSDFASDVLAELDPIVRVATLKRLCEPTSATPAELDALHIALRKRAGKLSSAPPSEPDLQFEDLSCLTDKQWKILLQHVNTACWAPALKTAPRGLRERVFNNMAAEPRTLMRREMDDLQEITDEEVAQARQQILDMCRALCEAGHLELRGR